MKIIFPILIIALLSSACSVLHGLTNNSMEHTNKNSKSVQLYYSWVPTKDNDLLTDIIRQCEDLGEVIGSEGSWYSYLLFSNTQLIQGAVNNIKNNAYETGANVVIVNKMVEFLTSITMLGQAYDCKAIAAK